MKRTFSSLKCFSFFFSVSKCYGNDPKAYLHGMLKLAKRQETDNTQSHTHIYIHIAKQEYGHKACQFKQNKQESFGRSHETVK